MEIVLAVVALILQVGGNYLQEAHIAVGNEYKKKITDLAKKIYSKISNNQMALDKLLDAYNQKNASLANAVFSQAGFGPAVKALNDEYKKNIEKMNKEKKKVNDENTKLSNEYNELTNAGAQTGTIAGNKYARETYNQVGQAVQGGLEDYEHHDIKSKNQEILDNIKDTVSNMNVPEPKGVY